MWQIVTEWWTRSGALVRLKNLDDRMLADMGLDRDGLRARVMGRAGAIPEGSPASPPAPATCHCA